MSPSSGSLHAITNKQPPKIPDWAKKGYTPPPPPKKPGGKSDLGYTPPPAPPKGGGGKKK